MPQRLASAHPALAPKCEAIFARTLSPGHGPVSVEPWKGDRKRPRYRDPCEVQVLPPHSKKALNYASIFMNRGIKDYGTQGVSGGRANVAVSSLPFSSRFTAASRGPRSHWKRTRVSVLPLPDSVSPERQAP